MQQLCCLSRGNNSRTLRLILQNTKWQVNLGNGAGRRCTPMATFDLQKSERRPLWSPHSHLVKILANTDSSLTAVAQILCLYATSYFSKQLGNVHSQNPIYDLQLLISVHPQLLNISLNDRTNSCSLRKQWLRDRHLHLWKGLLKKKKKNLQPESNDFAL